MSEVKPTGREPALPGDSQQTGDEPELGGERRQLKRIAASRLRAEAVLRQRAWVGLHLRSYAHAEIDAFLADVAAEAADSPETFAQVLHRRLRQLDEPDTES